jgi:hypothetical protein
MLVQTVAARRRFGGTGLALAIVLMMGCGTPPPSSAAGCSDLLASTEGHFAPGIDARFFKYTNGSDSTCSLGAPEVSFIDHSGHPVDIPQDWTAGAKASSVQVGAHSTAFVPYAFTYPSCTEATISFDHIVTTFPRDVRVTIETAGGMCPGTRIQVSAPTLTQP